MRRILIALLVAVAVAVGCANSQSPDAATPPMATGTPSGAPRASSAASSASSPTVGRVHVENPFPGGVAIVNDTDSVVSIAWGLPIERAGDDGTWTNAHGMTMMTKCFDAPPSSKCVPIAPHSTYEPLPWTGWLGCTQCGSCRANAPARPGRYRVVALECETGVRHEGPAMTLVGEGRFAKTPHVYAPTDEPSAIVIDNEADEPVSFRMAVDVARLDAARGAYETVAHTGMSLSPDCSPDAGASACVTIPAHGTLRSMAYRPGCARCAKCALPSVRPGTYMHTVSLCEGSKPFYNQVYGYTFRTESFVVDANGVAKSSR